MATANPSGGNVGLLEWTSIGDYQRMMGQAKLRDMLDEYRTNSDQLVRNILSDQGRGDMESVAWNAHRLAGAAGSIGCAALNSQARHVQEIAESGNAETLEDALSRLTEIQDKSLLALDAVIGERMPSA